MKRIAVIIAVLCLLVLSLLPPTADCFNCAQFETACRSYAKFEYDSCMILTNRENADYCVDRADKAYIGCMHAHKCQIGVVVPGDY